MILRLVPLFVLHSVLLENAVVYHVAQGFTVSGSSSRIWGVRRQQRQGRRQEQVVAAKRGFGAGSEKKKKEKSVGQIKREKERNKYDEIASAGGQEYSEFNEVLSYLYIYIR